MGSFPDYTFMLPRQQMAKGLVYSGSGHRCAARARAPARQPAAAPPPTLRCCSPAPSSPPARRRRLRRVAQDLMLGKPLKFGIVGGSISWGEGVVRGREDWFSAFTLAVQQMVRARRARGQEGREGPSGRLGAGRLF
jgi:hypothetical protein